MGAPQVTDTNWLSTLLAETADQYRPKAADNIFNNNAATFLLKDKSMVDVRTSGYQLQVPIIVGKNTSVKSFKGYDAFSNDPQKGVVDAYAGFANYGGLIQISVDEMDSNANEEKIVDLLASKISICEMTILDDINDGLYKDGTGNANKDVLGLAAMCEASATPGEYMGVTNSRWVNQYVTGTAATILANLTTLYFACTDGRDVPDIILANTDYVGLYEAANRSTNGTGIQYVNAKLADAGFAALEFKQIPMVLDKSLDDNDSGGVGKAFMLNSKHLGMPFKELKTLPFVDSSSQFAKTGKMYVRLQLVTDRRNRQGVHELS